MTISNLILDISAISLVHHHSSKADQVSALLSWLDWIEDTKAELYKSVDMYADIESAALPVYVTDFPDFEFEGTDYATHDVTATLWGLLNRAMDLPTVEREPQPLLANIHSEELDQSTANLVYDVGQLALEGVFNLHCMVTCACYSSIFEEIPVANGDTGATEPDGVLASSVQEFALRFQASEFLGDLSDDEIKQAIRFEVIRQSGTTEGHNYCFHSQFFQSARDLQSLHKEGEARQFLRACAEAVLGLVLGDQHRMRVGRAGSNYRQAVGRADSRYLNRRYVNVATGIRLHYWDAGASGIEFSTVANHDDYSVPEPDSEPHSDESSRME